MFRRPCIICKSPLRQEMEFLRSKKYPLTTIAGKYAPAFENKPRNIENALRRHFKNVHPTAADLTPVTKEYLEQVKAEGPQDFNTYADRLLKVGFQKMDPKSVSHSSIIAARRAVIEEKKVEGTLKNQEKMMAMFFRGKPQKLEEKRQALEGEVVGSSK